jgi:hypothetical protein
METNQNNTYISKSLIEKKKTGLFSNKIFKKNEIVDFFSGKFVERNTFDSFKSMCASNLFLIDKSTSKYFLLTSSKEESDLIKSTGTANFATMNNPSSHIKIIPNTKICFKDNKFVLIASKLIHENDEIIVHRESSFFKHDNTAYSSKLKKMMSDWVYRNKMNVLKNKLIEKPLLNIILRAGRKTNFELYISSKDAQNIYNYFKANQPVQHSTVHTYDDIEGKSKHELKFKKKTQELLLNDDVKITDIKI